MREVTQIAFERNVAVCARYLAVHTLDAVESWLAYIAMWVETHGADAYTRRIGSATVGINGQVVNTRVGRAQLVLP